MTEGGSHMTDAERLVQRFVDQELSADERLRFVARLGRDETLRQAVLDLEYLLNEARQLERPPIPPAFVADVMARVGRAESAPTWWARLSDRIWAPRALRWHLAGALAGAGLVLALMAGALAVGRSWRGGDAVAPDTVAAAAPARVMVRLLVVNSAARSVAVAGDFNEWDPDRTPLERVSSDAWAVTIALEPGRYEYMFVVDGATWVPDPFAVERQDDGFGASNAVIDVRASGDAAL
jgi:hypothetical protein